MGTRQARASAAQASSAPPEGRRPLATWRSVARYPAAASASRTKNGLDPSSGRTRPNAMSARPVMAPPTHNPWLARTGLVGLSGPFVVESARAWPPRCEQRGSARRSCGFDAQLGGEPTKSAGRSTSYHGSVKATDSPSARALPSSASRALLVPSGAGSKRWGYIAEAPTRW